MGPLLSTTVTQRPGHTNPVVTWWWEGKQHHLSTDKLWIKPSTQTDRTRCLDAVSKDWVCGLHFLSDSHPGNSLYGQTRPACEEGSGCATPEYVPGLLTPSSVKSKFFCTDFVSTHWLSRGRSHSPASSEVKLSLANGWTYRHILVWPAVTLQCWPFPYTDWIGSLRSHQSAWRLTMSKSKCL